MVQKIYWKMHPVSCTNTHHDVTDLVKHQVVKNTKTWISRERNVIFLSNKKIINLCLRWHIWRNYYFVAEVTFKRTSCKKVSNWTVFLNSICYVWLSSKIYTRKFSALVADVFLINFYFLSQIRTTFKNLNHQRLKRQLEILQTTMVIIDCMFFPWS